MIRKFNNFLDNLLNFYLKKDKEWFQKMPDPKYSFAFIFFSILNVVIYFFNGDIVSKCLSILVLFYSISCYIYYKRNNRTLNLKVKMILTFNFYITMYILAYMMMMVICLDSFHFEKIYGITIIILFILLNIIYILIMLFIITIKDYIKPKDKANKKMHPGLSMFFIALSASGGILLSRFIRTLDDKIQGYSALIMLVIFMMTLMIIIFPVASLLMFRNLDYDYNKEEV